MKLLVAILASLLIVETYGVYGAWKAERLAFTCNLRMGPLCYAWEESALGKVLGTEKAEALEGKLQEAKTAWEEEVIEKTLRAADEGELERALDHAGDAVKEALDAARETAREALQGAKP